MLLDVRISPGDPQYQRVMDIRQARMERQEQATEPLVDEIRALPPSPQRDSIRTVTNGPTRVKLYA